MLKICDQLRQQEGEKASGAGVREQGTPNKGTGHMLRVSTAWVCFGIGLLLRCVLILRHPQVPQAITYT